MQIRIICWFPATRTSFINRLQKDFGKNGDITLGVDGNKVTYDLNSEVTDDTAAYLLLLDEEDLPNILKETNPLKVAQKPIAIYGCNISPEIVTRFSKTIKEQWGIPFQEINTETGYQIEKPLLELTRKLMEYRNKCNKSVINMSNLSGNYSVSININDIKKILESCAIVLDKYKDGKEILRYFGSI